jgi:hypothetical protein
MVLQRYRSVLTPDSLIRLIISNDSKYPLYDVSITLPNPDPAVTVQRMVKLNRLLNWDEMRNNWIFTPTFAIPQGGWKIFYEFKLSESLSHTVVFMTITTRNGVFSGRIVLRRFNGLFRYYSEVSDSRHKLLNTVHPELKAVFEVELKNEIEAFKPKRKSNKEDGR